MLDELKPRNRIFGGFAHLSVKTTQLVLDEGYRRLSWLENTVREYPAKENFASQVQLYNSVTKGQLDSRRDSWKETCYTEIESDWYLTKLLRGIEQPSWIVRSLSSQTWLPTTYVCTFCIWVIGSTYTNKRAKPYLVLRHSSVTSQTKV